MKNYRDVLLAMIFVFVSVGLFAAGGKEEPVKPTGPVTIDFIHCTGGNAQKATLELTDRFNNSQNEVIVEVSCG